MSDLRMSVVAASSLKAHPQLGNDAVLPPLSEHEYAGLLASIEAIGIKQPLVVTEDGVILDGHHRWRVARELGLPEVPVVTEPNADESRHFALGLSPSLHRRHLTWVQKRSVITRLLQSEPDGAG